MTFSVSGAQIVGFVAFLVLVGPSMVLVGVLWQRVKNNSDSILRVETRLVAEIHDLRSWIKNGCKEEA